VRRQALQKRGVVQVTCPHCSKAFKIDEAGYADILKQVRDGDFENQLHERLELAEREKRDAIALAEANVTNALQKTAAAKDKEIQALKAQLDAGEVARKLAVTEALGTVSKERDQLAEAKLAASDTARKLAITVLGALAERGHHQVRNPVGRIQDGVWPQFALGL
jgi:hypothetical protein